MRRPAMFVRFPSLAGAADVLAADLPRGRPTDYPELADDITHLDQDVGPAFREADLAALRHQNRYRRQQVVDHPRLGAADRARRPAGGVPRAKWPGLLLALLGACSRC